MHHYWPDRQPRPLGGKLVVEMTNEATYDDYIVRDFRVTNTEVRLCKRYSEILWLVKSTGFNISETLETPGKAIEISSKPRKIS